MLTVRPATREDAPTVLSLIDALADFEKLDRPDADARKRILEDGWERTPPRFHVLLVEHDGVTIGHAIYFFTYSTFLARPTLYLEDLFVLPESRGAGAGKTLLRALAAEAKKQECGRLEWACLNWNQPAIDFYEKRLGATHLEEWRTYRLLDDGITQLLQENQT